MGERLRRMTAREVEGLAQAARISVGFAEGQPSQVAAAGNRLSGDRSRASWPHAACWDVARNSQRRGNP